MPFGVFFCEGFAALDWPLGQGRELFLYSENAPSVPPDGAQGKPEAPGAKGQKRGRRPHPEGRTAA